MPASRIKLVDVKVTLRSDKCESEVTLSRMGVERKGEERGTIGREIDQLKHIANATIEAITQFYQGLFLVVTDVREFPIADGKVIVVVITITFSESDVDLQIAGSSLVKVSTHRACAEATLDAVNRILLDYEPDVRIENRFQMKDRSAED